MTRLTERTTNLKAVTANNVEVYKNNTKQKNDNDNAHLQPGIDQANEDVQQCEERVRQAKAKAVQLNQGLEDQIRNNNTTCETNVTTLNDNLKTELAEIQTQVDQQIENEKECVEQAIKFDGRVRNGGCVANMSHNDVVEMLVRCSPNADLTSIANNPNFKGVSLTGLKESQMAKHMKMKTIGECRTLTVSLKNINKGNGMPLSLLAKHMAHSADDVRFWTIQQVIAWLKNKGYSAKVLHRFEEELITGLVLLNLDGDDLEILGIEFLEQGELMREIEIMRKSSGFGHHNNSNSNSNSNGASSSSSSSASGAGATQPSGMSSDELASILDQVFTSSDELQTKLKKQEDLVRELNLNLANVEEGFKCPLMFTIMEDPVIALDGHNYERAFIEEALQYRAVSPMTNEPMARTLIPNIELRNRIKAFLAAEKKKKDDDKQ